MVVDDEAKIREVVASFPENIKDALHRFFTTVY